MVTNGGDAGHRLNGKARRFRETTEEERAIHRRWLRGVIFFYFGLLFVSGVAIATYSGARLSQMTDLSVKKAVAAALTK